MNSKFSLLGIAGLIYVGYLIQHAIEHEHSMQEYRTKMERQRGWWRHLSKTFKASENTAEYDPAMDKIFGHSTVSEDARV